MTALHALARPSTNPSESLEGPHGGPGTGQPLPTAPPSPPILLSFRGLSPPGLFTQLQNEGMLISPLPKLRVNMCTSGSPAAWGNGNATPTQSPVNSPYTDNGSFGGLETHTELLPVNDLVDTSAGCTGLFCSPDGRTAPRSCVASSKC